MVMQNAPFYPIVQNPSLGNSGQYSSCTRELFVDLRSGGDRTLVHEMVHAYINADFRSAPVWIHEGLATLLADGAVDEHGEVRATESPRAYFHLRYALMGSDVPSFERMANAGKVAFYGPGGSWMYATAHHLLFWLLHQKLLQIFYREYRSHAAEDPTGLATLERVTGRTLPELRSEWERFIIQQWERNKDRFMRELQEVPR